MTSLFYIIVFVISFAGVALLHSATDPMQQLNPEDRSNAYILGNIFLVISVIMTLLLTFTFAGAYDPLYEVVGLYF